jgi:hypothetical protein
MRSLLVVLSLLTACTVGGDLPPAGLDAAGGGGGGGGGGVIDAPGAAIDAPQLGSGSGSGSGGGSAAFKCRNQVTTGLTDGHHNAGMDCQDACHNHGFTLAGTLYTSAAGTTAIAGGTITVLGANGVSVDVVSQQNGNFYTSAALSFPVTVTASECPNIAPMSATVTAPGGCNANGCHNSAAGQGRVHLP